MSYIFISYSKRNKDYAYGLADFLQAQGFNIWIDRVGIEYGENWERVIFKAIDGCAAFLVIMTPESYESDWVLRECHHADKRRKKQFPLLLEGEEFPRYGLTQYANVRGGKMPPEDFLARLRQVITPQAQQGKNVAPPEVPEPANFIPEQKQLLDRIDDPNTEPPERLKIGLRLAEIGDPRPGVGLDKNGLPEMDWVKIPAGEFIYGEGNKQQKIRLNEFYIARYPVTYIQFQAFIDAKDGFYDDRWWQGLAERSQKPDERRWKVANYPHDHVSWYAAIAFCRWLSWKLLSSPLSPSGRGDGGEGFDLMNPFTWPVRLPTEQEWERAARGTDGRIYPWGNEYISGYANCDELRKKVGIYKLSQTTAVGVYPQGASTDGVLDMSGNILEWMLNEYESGLNNIIDKNMRGLRGGSWYSNYEKMRAALRNSGDPSFESDMIGFRCVSTFPVVGV